MDDRDRGFPTYGGGLSSSMRRLGDEVDRMFDSSPGGRSRWSTSGYGYDESGRYGHGASTQDTERRQPRRLQVDDGSGRTAEPKASPKIDPESGGSAMP
jgi:hypothetical protein